MKAIDMVDVIDGNLGELSTFHSTFGFYVHGVSIDAAVLPTGWQERAIEVRNENTRNNTGWCVEAHDLAASKLVAFRDKDKDKDFVRTLFVEKLIDQRKLYRRVQQLSNSPRVKPELLAVIKAWIGGVLKDIGEQGRNPGYTGTRACGSEEWETAAIMRITLGSLNGKQRLTETKASFADMDSRGAGQDRRERAKQLQNFLSEQVMANAISYLQIDLTLSISHPVCMEVAGGSS